MTYSKEITEVLSHKQGTPLSSLHTCLKQQVWLESPTMLLPTLGNQRHKTNRGGTSVENRRKNLGLVKLGAVTYGPTKEMPICVQSQPPQHLEQSPSEHSWTGPPVRAPISGSGRAPFGAPRPGAEREGRSPGLSSRRMRGSERRISL